MTKREIVEAIKDLHDDARICLSIKDSSMGVPPTIYDYDIGKVIIKNDVIYLHQGKEV